MTDPPAIVRRIASFAGNRVVDPQRRAKRRAKAEAARVKAGAPHRVEYFHQHDDPYSHLAQQVLDTFRDRYEIDLVIHQVRASGGKNQPELAKLAAWAARDADLIAPHYGLQRPSDMADRWDVAPPAAVLDAGSARLTAMGHYSGAMFHYGGEWYWGVDRLFHLEQRLRDLGACKQPARPDICPRPPIDVSGADARHLTLDFYPSLNSPYTSIIYDRTIAMAKACGITLHHKPVLPMVMRGVPATRQKGSYILFDTKREAEFLGVDFGPMVFPVGEPTRAMYSLIPWACEQGRDVELLSAALRLAWGEGVGLHRRKGICQAVERAGLDWSAAQRHLGSDAWKEETARRQLEMTEELGLWGVPSYRLRGGAGEADLCVWGQDRLWLIAGEIRRRAALPAQPSGIVG
ncbi:MAG: 2-hydroxychromene-2-carboxylate isomerase [Sphingomonas sp.]|nr:2-hydroxychromene-2-carboxylate isomerase [Sphingomonas sp.]